MDLGREKIVRSGDCGKGFWNDLFGQEMAIVWSGWWEREEETRVVGDGYFGFQLVEKWSKRREIFVRSECGRAGKGKWAHKLVTRGSHSGRRWRGEVRREAELV
jgi:hypothetical protein